MKVGASTIEGVSEKIKYQVKKSGQKGDDVEEQAIKVLNQQERLSDKLKQIQALYLTLKKQGSTDSFTKALLTLLPSASFVQTATTTD